jgi:hypothetical protein
MLIRLRGLMVALRQLLTMPYGPWARRLSLSTMALVCLMSLAGCRRGPSRVEAPDWDPEGLAERIVTDLDKNGDGKIDADEMTAAPGLAAGARFIDTNKDDQLTQEELAARFEMYEEREIGLRSHTFRLTYKGRPVPEAEVIFNPEPYLEGIIEPAKGTTDAQGVVAPRTVGIDLPVEAMRIGYYRVQVNSPHVKIPTKYQSADTPLGAEVTLSDDASSYGMTLLELTD